MRKIQKIDFSRRAWPPGWAWKMCGLDGLITQPMEMQIDNEAIAYMNLRAPVATELRLVIVGMKASHDLERVGDEATSIAKRAVRLAAEPPLKPYVDIPRMANIALEMLRDALDCFLHGDTEKALAVVKRDIDLPRPRDLEVTYTPQFTDIVHELRGHIGAIRQPVGAAAVPQ